MRRTLVAAGLVVAVLASAPDGPRALGQDAPSRAADGPGTYAGRDAEWWVGELRGAGTQRVATEALKIIGAHAVPAIATVIDDRDPVLRAVATGLLRDIPGSLLPARDALGRALDAAADAAREVQLLELILRLDAEGAPLAPIVVRRLSSPLPGVRRSALNALSRIGGDPAVLVPALRPLLRDEDGSAVSAVLQALERCGPRAADAVPDLIDMLEAGGPPSARRSRRSAGVHRQAVETLRGIGRVGPRAHAALVALAADPELRLADPCCRALADIAAVEPEAADALLGLAESPLASVRTAALTHLASLRPFSSPVVERLLRLLDAEDAETASAAAAALSGGGVDRSRYLGPLLRRIARLAPSDRSQGLWEALRVAAVEPWRPFVEAIPSDLAPPPPGLLGLLAQCAPSIGASDARDALADRLVRWVGAPAAAGGEPGRLLGVFSALGLPARDLAVRLGPHLFGPDGDARAAALRVLAGAPDAQGVVRDLLGSDDPRRRMTALDLLGTSGLPWNGAMDEVARLLTDADPEVRARAFGHLVLGTSYCAVLPGRPEGERDAFCSVLVEAIGSPDGARRMAAVRAVHAVPGRCAKALDGLIEALADPDPGVDPQMVAGAVAVAAGLDTRAVRERLRRRLEEDGPEVRRAGAALALATMGEELDAVDKAMPGLLESGPWPSRLRAILAASRLGARARPFEAALCRLTVHATPCVATAACHALAAVAPGSKPALEALASVARDRASPARVAAVSVLSAFGGAATDVLVALLGDPNVRGSALQALQAMGPLAHDAVPALEEELRANPADPHLRAALDAIRPR